MERREDIPDRGQGVTGRRWEPANLGEEWRLEQDMTPTGIYLLDQSPRLVFGEQRIEKEDCGQGVVDLD